MAESGLKTFWSELRRRKVVKAAIIYVVVAWLLIQIAEVIFEPLKLPDWSLTLVIVLAAITLPLGITQSKEYAELEWPIDLLIAVVWVAYAVVFLATIVLILKFTIRRSRPAGDWGEVYRSTDPHSFPSGHAARVSYIAVMAIGAIAGSWTAVAFASAADAVEFGGKVQLCLVEPAAGISHLGQPGAGVTGAGAGRLARTAG